MRAQNYQGLKDWVGDIPDHGGALGLRETVDDACRLLSARSADDVSNMLGLMASTARNLADDGAYRLPPAARGWKLHGTGLWRVITATLSRKSAKALGCKPWEYVAAMALYCAHRAVQALRRDPVGIGLHPLMAGEGAQKLAAHAALWLRHACSERDAADVEVGRNRRAAQKQRAKNKGQAWRQAAINQWHERAPEFNGSLPKFCENIAGTSLRLPSGGAVNVPSHETVYRTMLKARKMGEIG